MSINTVMLTLTNLCNQFYSYNYMVYFMWMFSVNIIIEINIVL